MIGEPSATESARLIAHCALRLGPKAQPGQYGEAHLAFIPYRPLWYGLATNVALYTSVMWFAHSATRSLAPGWRRWLHRNRCSYCGYDLRGKRNALCPECGKSPGPA